MSDTYRRHRAIKQRLMQFYQPRPTGQCERHLNTLVAMICGLTGGQRAQLATMADHAPSGSADPESVMARFRRWLKHEAQTVDGWFLVERLHRRDRCDLSLFRVGLRLLARCLKDDLPIPPGFLVPAIAPSKPIRQRIKQAA